VTISKEKNSLKKKAHRKLLKVVWFYFENIVFYRCKNSKEEILFVKISIVKFLGSRR
jgi:hypothetical protein